MSLVQRNIGILIEHFVESLPGPIQEASYSFFMTEDISSKGQAILE